MKRDYILNQTGIFQCFLIRQFNEVIEGLLSFKKRLFMRIKLNNNINTETIVKQRIKRSLYLPAKIQFFYIKVIKRAVLSHNFTLSRVLAEFA